MIAPSGKPGSTKVTYLGHASFLFEHGGGTIVADPVFSDRIGGMFTRRTVPSRFRPEDLAGVVGVLISHGHHDHLDYRSLKRVTRSNPILVPWGISGSLRLRGFTDVRVIRPWEEMVLGGWRLTAVPSRHFGGRLPLVYTSGHLGYVLSGVSSIYFAGDTGLNQEMFRAIGQKFRLALAILRGGRPRMASVGMFSAVKHKGAGPLQTQRHPSGGKRRGPSCPMKALVIADCSS
ncbi:MAG: MBL fold metallo-hydrolase [Thermoplasmata archaeon]